MKINAEKYKTGETLKFIREWTGLTQSEFAQMIGKGISTIQSYELNRRQYTFDMLITLAKIYDLEIVIKKK